MFAARTLHSTIWWVAKWLCWCRKEWLEQNPGHRGVQAREITVEGVRRMFNSEWMNDIITARVVQVMSRCVGHDCGVCHPLPHMPCVILVMWVLPMVLLQGTRVVG